MSLKALQHNWHIFGKLDPLWAILTLPNKQGGKWQLDEFFATGQQEIERVMQEAKDLNIAINHNRALDFGCGVGRLTQALANYFEEVHGVDIAPSMIEMAKQYNRCGEQCQYHLNAQADLKLFSDNFFDVIYSNITLQHMPTEYSIKYIEEFVRILTLDGVAVFQIPSEPTPKTNEILTNSVSDNSLRTWIKQLIPIKILDIYRQLRYGKDVSKRATMEMYGIHTEELVKLLESKGIAIIQIKPDPSAGKGWSSFQYWIQKKP